MKNKMIAEEQEILDWFEQGELYSASEADHEHEVALQAAHNMLVDWFEQGELCSVSEADHEHEVALQAAHNMLADWFEQGELRSASEADLESEVALQAAHNTRPIVSYIKALGRRLKTIAEFLKGRSENRPWAVPATAAGAVILAIVMVPALFDQASEEPTFMPPIDRPPELVPVHGGQATDEMPLLHLLVGTEERLKEDGLLETDHGFFCRKYEMVAKPKADNPQVKVVSIGERLPLKPDQELKVLIGLSGELKKGSDYQVEKSPGTTFITFTNEILSGKAVLAVVEAKN